MTIAKLEHVNVTVSDARKTAETLCRLYGWTVRWSGKSMNDGETFHIGNDDFYIALYTNPQTRASKDHNHGTLANLNHIALVVDDLEAVERRIKSAGYKTHNHGDYEPGRRFYYHDEDGIEFEIVSYQPSFKQQFVETLGVMSRNGALVK